MFGEEENLCKSSRKGNPLFYILGAKITIPGSRVMVGGHDNSIVVQLNTTVLDVDRRPIFTNVAEFLELRGRLLTAEFF